MKTSDFYYDLPPECIAQHGEEKRDASRLLVYHRKDGTIEDRHFYDVLDYLQEGDCLVLNRTRVIPARLYGQRKTDDQNGGKMEFLLLKQREGNCWEVLVKPGRRAKEGVWFTFGDHLEAVVRGMGEDGSRVVEFFYDGVFEERLEEIGQMPLPPYITEKLADKTRYQTVYAKEAGSAAAPTAGLHFTPELLDALQKKGIEVAEVLLHVGLGTFRPVKVDDVLNHHMHSEYYEVDQKAADTINRAKQAGGRVVCVGTTSARTLETVTDDAGRIRAKSGWTDIFIYPGYTFKAVDALITNFHLPESTLLMLVSALASRDEMLRVYHYAVAQGYRFFSFGDAMLIL